MRKGIMWGGRYNGCLMENPTDCLALPRPMVGYFKWDEPPPVSTIFEYDVYDYHERYWPGLGIEGVWLQKADYQRLLDDERKYQ